MSFNIKNLLLDEKAEYRADLTGCAFYKMGRHYLKEKFAHHMISDVLEVEYGVFEQYIKSYLVARNLDFKTTGIDPDYLLSYADQTPMLLKVEEQITYDEKRLNTVTTDKYFEIIQLSDFLKDMPNPHSYEDSDTRDFMTDCYLKMCEYEPNNLMWQLDMLVH